MSSGCLWRWKVNGSSGSRKLTGKKNVVIEPEAGTRPIDLAALWAALVAN